MSSDRRVLAGFTLALFFVASAAAAAHAQSPRRGLVSFAYDFDFESGSVGAWSSYPPAQDTAYDPTIEVKKIGGNPSLALVREIRPNYPIDYVFGVRRKLHILIDRQSRLRFKYFAKNYGRTDAIVVKLALGGGLAKEVRIPAGENLAWHEADISLAAFASSDAPTQLDAVAIMAACPQADPEAALGFAIDDVCVAGWRPKTVSISEPRAHWLEEFSAFVAGKHFEEGEPIDFHVELPAEDAGGFVRVAGVQPSGKPIDLRLAKLGRMFAARLPRDRVKAGLWRADFFKGPDADKNGATILYFLVRAKGAPTSHPRLFLASPEKARLLELIRQPGAGRDAWESIEEVARSYRAKYRPADFVYNLEAYDEVFWLPTYGGYANTIRTISGFARANAFVYSLWGDREAGLAAKEALLKVASWPTLVHPHILDQGQFTYWPVGLAYMDLAAAYDEVYDLLSPTERLAIASALYRKGIVQIFNEYVRDDRVSSATSNWISHVTGGGILSAVAVGGEIGDEDLEPYLTGMVLKLFHLVESTFDRDGDYGEGYGYHNFTMESLSEIMSVLARHFGIVWPEKVFRSHLYLPYQMNSKTREVYDFGDTGSRLLPLSNFAYILHTTRDPLLAWLAGLAPGRSEADLEFADGGVRPEPPGGSLPPVKLFRDVGTAVFRSGFEPDDFAFIFRAGPFFNHQHFDQGSFYLADRGQNFLVEGGRTDYYNDPWYQGFFIQPGAHNCLLVDENVESQRAGDILNDVSAWRDDARITDFLDFTEGALLSAELGPIYKGRFETLRRTVLYLKPRTIVIIDSGSGARQAARLDLRFHAPLKEDISVAGDTARIARGTQALLLRTLYPARHASSVLKRPLSLDEFKTEDPLKMKARGFLQLTCDIEDAAVQVINVLGTDPAVVEGARLRDGGTHLELEIGGRLFLIRRVPGRGGFENAGKTIDADLFSQSGQTLRALRVSEVREGKRTVFRADSPVSLALETTARSAAASISADQKTTIFLACPSHPRGVKRDGVSTRAWSWDHGLLRLEIPSGGTSIDVNFD